MELFIRFMGNKQSLGDFLRNPDRNMAFWGKERVNYAVGDEDLIASHCSQLLSLVTGWQILKKNVIDKQIIILKYNYVPHMEIMCGRNKYSSLPHLFVSVSLESN